MVIGVGGTLSLGPVAGKTTTPTALVTGVYPFPKSTSGDVLKLPAISVVYNLALKYFPAQGLAVAVLGIV